VARLIAKGFKGERPRLNQTGSAWDINYESASAVDNSRENYHYLSINRGVSATYDVTLNLSNIDVAVGQVVEVQEVSANHHGAVSRYLTVPANKTLTFTQPVTSVYMLSIPKGQSVRQQVTLAPVADAQVSNATPLVNYGALSTASVARSATTTADQATYLKFNLGANDKSKVSRAVLSLTGANAVDSTLATLHVYGILNDSWNELTINWSNAPDLAGASDAKLANVGTDVFPVGQLTWNNAASEWGIDVTDFVRKHPNADLSFVVIREQRFTNDGAGEIARIDLNTREAASGSPKLALSLYSQPHHFWNTNFNANFSAASSWDSGAAPNSAGAVAVLGDFITSPHTVTLDASATLGTLSFQSWNTYTVTGAAARTLTLSNPTANSAINVFQGSHVLSTPLALASATDINTLTGTTLTIDKSISGSAALNKLGPGTLILSPTSIKFTGALRINQGLVRVGASGATGVSHLSSLSIAAGAALDMTDNDLIVDSTPSPPSATTSLRASAQQRASPAPPPPARPSSPS
jgi:autotransporter-associated beta strand protein